MPPADLRLGLVGAGRWGRAYIATLAAVDGVRLARLASRNPDARTVVDDDCAVCRDWRELLSAGDLDGVVVATPPATHGEIATAAVESGLPVLVEKPLTLDPGDAEALLVLAEARGGLVRVDHIYLFHPAFRAMKREARTLGAPRALRTVGGNWGPFRDDVPVLWDWGPHDVAMCLDLVGERPTTVAARRLERRPADGGTGETLALGLTFADGLAADIRIGNLMAERVRVFAADFAGHELTFSDEAGGRLTLADRPEGPRGAGEAQPARTLPVAADRPLSVAVREFAEAIRAGSTDLAGLRLGVDVVSVLAACEARLAASPEA